ncbi:hypothetical protein KKHLCK_16565 [Candidatus Electrothrix laxa]
MGAIMKQIKINCWVICGTHCKQPVNDSSNNTECLHCDFYHMVRRDEMPYFKVTGVVMREIKSRGAVPVHS